MRFLNISIWDSLTDWLAGLWAPPDTGRRRSKLTTIGGQDGLTRGCPPPGPYCEISNRNITQTGAIMGSCPRPTLQPEYRRDLRKKVVTGNLLFQMWEERNVYSSSMFYLRMLDLRFIIIALIHIGLQDWTLPLYLRPFILFNLNNHHFSSEQRNYIYKYGFEVDSVIRAKWSR